MLVSTYQPGAAARPRHAHVATRDDAQQSPRLRGGDNRPNLTSREVEVLRCWLQSDSKTHVARRLYLSPGTVNTHLARIRAKYEAVGRPAATKAVLAARALQDGLVHIDDL